MRSIEVEGRVLIKAADAAKELSYTSDYIGQLCRAGKIHAKLVGRSWYVDVDDLREHKKTRYSKSATATPVPTDTLATQESNLSSEIRTELPLTTAGTDDRVAIKELSIADNVDKPKLSDHEFYKYSNQPAKLTYLEDTSELVPTLVRPGTGTDNRSAAVPIRLAGADSVPVEATTPATSRFTVTGREPVRFKGTLSVSDISTNPVRSARYSNPSDGKSRQQERNSKEDNSFYERLERKNLAKERSQHVLKTKPLANSDKAKLSITLHSGKQDETIENDVKFTSSDLSKNPSSVASSAVHEEPKQVPLVQVVSPSRTGRFTYVYITASCFLLLAFMLSLFTLERSLKVDKNGNVDSLQLKADLMSIYPN